MGEPLDGVLDALDDMLRPVGDLAEGQIAGREPSNQFFGPYQLLGEIGAGGVARVLRARHIHPTYAHQLYAVKLLHASLGQDEKIVPLFRREAYILALLQHPNIVQTHEAGIQDNQLYIAMEYIAGVDMDGLLRRCRHQQIPLPQPLILYIVAQVLQALAFAHELTDDGKPLQLIHRDVNPANVFIGFDGQVKLGDFGVAGLLAEHRPGKVELIGKLGYFAPEQLQGGTFDQRADLYAVGVMLYEALFQRPLFQGETQEALLKANKKAQLPSFQHAWPALSPAFESCLRKALQPKPQDRYASARHMLQDVLQLLGEPQGCALGLASLMRRMCLAEFERSLAIVAESYPHLQQQPHPRHVLVLMPESAGQQAFVQLLTSRGILASGGDSLIHLQAQLMAGAPQVIVCQVGTGLLPQVRHTLGARNIPIVGIGEELTPACWQSAAQGGVVDVLCKPYGMERTWLAIQAGWFHSHQHKQAPSHVEVERALPLQRCLLLCHDPVIQGVWQERMLQAGFEVDMFTDVSAALIAGQHRIHHVLLIDSHLGEYACLQFVASYRQLPGVARLPVLLLQATSPHAWKNTLLERMHWMDANTSKEQLEVIWHTLHKDTKEHRSFVRYPGQWSATMRYSGRILPCLIHDISRGGISLRCQHIPVVGAKVAIDWEVPALPEHIALQGLILRVELMKQEGQELAQVALRLIGFVDQGERAMLTYLATLPVLAEPLAQQSPEALWSGKSGRGWQDFLKGWRKESKG